MPKITVRAARLDDGAPAAVVDTVSYCELVVDFNQPPDVVAAALQELIQEAVDSGRWTRRNTKPDPQ